MRRRSCSFTLIGLLSLAPACFPEDEGAETGADSGCATDDPATGTAAPSDSGTAAADTASDETAAPPSTCGWGPTGDASVPDGYVCGGDGADPSGAFPMGCPEAVMLEVGAACSGIVGPGCCDAEGNAWFCGDQGSGPALARIEC